MHRVWEIDEIVRLIVSHLKRHKQGAVALACCSRSLSDIVLDSLWEHLVGLSRLLKCLPRDTWTTRDFDFVRIIFSGLLALEELKGEQVFLRCPTTEEWLRFSTYARRVHSFSAAGYAMDSVSSEAYRLLSIQAPTLGHYILPNLRSIKWDIHPWRDVPFIHLFLNPELVDVHIVFPNPRPNIYRLAVVSSIPTKELTHLRLERMGNEDSVLVAIQSLVDKTSETLRSVALDGDLSMALIDKLLRLQDLGSLEIELPKTRISPPDVVLPSLERLAVRCREDVPWFHILKNIPNPALREVEATFLDSSSIHLQNLTSALIDANKRRNLTKLQCSWEKLIPLTEEGLRSALPFDRLTTLNLLPRCIEGQCGVQLEDTVICDLSTALPKLESLKLGGAPCTIPASNVTIKSLAALSTNCVHLDFLQLHFDVNEIASRQSFADYQTQTFTSRLRTLSVGTQPLPSDPEDILLVAMTILYIFPHVKLSHADGNWRKVRAAIELSQGGLSSTE